jgi:hypothetical protein
MGAGLTLFFPPFFVQQGEAITWLYSGCMDLHVRRKGVGFARANVAIASLVSFTTNSRYPACKAFESESARVLSL